MRVFKFRAWDGEEMVYGVGIEQNGIAYKFPKDSEPDDMAIDSADYYPDHNPMQYTGLKDKNGVEIYEGDIVDIYWPEEVKPVDRYWSGAEIVWWDAGFRILHDLIGHDPHHKDFFVSGESACDLWDDPEVMQVTVKGNIYENPELLKEQE